MGLAAGIVGLPNVGKSTIFNALSAGRAAAENYPFCTIEPNIGIVAVPDERLRRLTSLISTKKVVPGFIELVDIAGLVKGASRGEGLGNQFLGHIKNVNAIVHVVRCFFDSDVVHAGGSIDPQRDVETVETELLLKDMETVEKGIERVGKLAKSGDKAAKTKLSVFEKAHEVLSGGTALRTGISEPQELSELQELYLLTAKSVLYVANISEEEIERDSEAVSSLKEYALCNGSMCIKICGKIESEIAELREDERKEFLLSMGLKEPGLDLLAQSVFKLLGLITFFTAQPNETRAWSAPVGISASKAAGLIHSDFERGFICAEVFRLEDLEQHGTETALRAAGKVRQEGREYVVKDGDIIFFRFNV